MKNKIITLVIVGGLLFGQCSWVCAEELLPDEPVLEVMDTDEILEEDAEENSDASEIEELVPEEILAAEDEEIDNSQGAPVIESWYISNISRDGFRVNCVVKGNDIDRVMFPIWTDKNGQDDLPDFCDTNIKCKGFWNSYDKVYSYDVKRSDHNGEFGFYHTHIYAYAKDGSYSMVITKGITLYDREKKTRGYGFAIPTFLDVDNSAYYYRGVYWAADREITTGTAYRYFSPNDPCTRGQVVAFLWRSLGSPEPKTRKSPFSDVQDSSKYYYKAVLWAVENGITTGTSKTTFSPDDTVTRGQFVSFLNRMAGQPDAGGKTTFRDVASSKYYATPIEWAYRTGITTGTSKTTFSPESPCTRGQVVTFLYRAYFNQVYNGFIR